MDQALNDAPCGFIIFNDLGIIREANRTLTTLLQYPEGSLNGNSVEFIFTIATKIFYNTHLFPLLKLEGKANEIFFSLSTSNKQSVPIIANVLRKAVGKDFEIHCALFPITQRNKYEQELLAAKKAAEDANRENKQLLDLQAQLEEHSEELDEKAALAVQAHKRLMELNKILSHDYQEPIRKILVFTDVMRSSGGDRNLVADADPLDKIEGAANRLRKLSTILEQFIRLELPDSRSNVDLIDVIRTAEDRAKSKTGKQFNVDISQLPVITGFAWQLEELFYHLIENAVVHHTNDSPIDISIDGILIKENLFKIIPDRYRYIDYLRITVQDNGPGFDNQFSEYVFDIMNRVSTENKSLGLGLALSRKIVENHAGQISIKTSKGDGTAVTIELPVSRN